MDRIKQLRWRQRSLPEDVQTNLSPQEIQVTHPPSHPSAFPVFHECMHRSSIAP